MVAATADARTRGRSEVMLSTQRRRQPAGRWSGRGVRRLWLAKVAENLTHVFDGEVVSGLAILEAREHDRRCIQLPAVDFAARQELSAVAASTVPSGVSVRHDADVSGLWETGG